VLKFVNIYTKCTINGLKQKINFISQWTKLRSAINRNDHKRCRKFPVFWNLMSCCLVGRYGSSSAVCFPHLQLKMEAANCLSISLHSFTSQNTAFFTLTALITDKQLIYDLQISNKSDDFILYPNK
jgi:hypothetical protein